MTRQVICADALEWMATSSERGSVVTSPPDAEEIGAGPDRWAAFYARALDLALGMAEPLLIVYATDRLRSGRWISKASMVHSAAARAGARVLWHKIALRRDPGKTDLHRPTYSHLIAVAHGKSGPGQRTPDVLEPGRPIYPNGVPINVARLAVGFALSKHRTIIDPFCGRGTFLALAEWMGADRAIGVDIDPDQCAAAQRLRVKPR